MGNRLKELIICLSNCHCRWLFVLKCCKNSQCMSEIEEYPHNSPQNTPQTKKKNEILI
jgi:hypothetical protein